MRVYYDNRHKQWCAEETNDNESIAAWGETKEEAIKRFNHAKQKR